MSSKRSRTSPEFNESIQVALCDHHLITDELKASIWKVVLSSTFSSEQKEPITSKLDLVDGCNLFCVTCDDFVFNGDTDAVIMHASYERQREILDGTVSSIKPILGVGLRGLVNLGNTCFMNSVLQVLLHLDQIRDFFLSGKHRSVCIPAARAVAAPSVAPETNAYRYKGIWRRPWSEPKEIAMKVNASDIGVTTADVAACFGCELEILFGEAACPARITQAPPMIPYRILQHLWAHSPALAGYYQQDAQELYNALVNAVHSHICSPLTLSGPISRSPTPTLSGGNAEPSSPSGANQRDGSLACQCIIHRELGGVLRSQLTCDTCQNSSSRFEPFFELPLDLSRQEESSLEACLDAFVLPETLSDVHCSQCDIQRVALKRLSLHILPSTLALHLKRFQSNHAAPINGTNHLEKNQIKVRFPLTGLNVKPFVSSPCRCQGKCECFLFDLKAVVQHTGQLAGGHYISFVRAQDQLWFKFDDHFVSRVSPEEVADAEAYMLFYEAQTNRNSA